MIGCDFCEEWFHPDCLSITIEEAYSLTEVKWKCPLCEGKATIDYENEKQSATFVSNKTDVHSLASTNSEMSNEKKSEPMRLKVNVSPGEWLWLVGDQLIPPTNEELVRER